jgi:hypothetical protein
MSSSAEALLIQEEGLLIQPMLYEKYIIVDKSMVISSAIELLNKDNRLLMATDNDDNLAADSLQVDLQQ